MSNEQNREQVRAQLERAWDGEEKWEGDFVRPSNAARERMIDALLSSTPPQPVEGQSREVGLVREDETTLRSPASPEEYAAVLRDMAWKCHGGHYNPTGAALIGAAHLIERLSATPAPTDDGQSREQRAREFLNEKFASQGWSRPPAFMGIDTCISAMLAFADATPPISCKYCGKE